MKFKYKKYSSMHVSLTEKKDKKNKKIYSIIDKKLYKYALYKCPISRFCYCEKNVAWVFSAIFTLCFRQDR